MKTIFVLFFISLPVLLNAQWTFRSERHIGWGTYKYATAIGESDNEDCPNPVLIINRQEDQDQLHVYFTDLCRICEGVYVQFKCDSNYTTYMNEYECYYNNLRHEIRMPDCYTSLTGKKLSEEFFLEKIKKCNTLYIKITDRCGTTNITYSMEGYNKAYKQVLKK